MTYRERRERKAERLRGWAEKRQANAAASFGAVQALADTIPLGQPILVGHHSEGRARRDVERIRSGMTRGIEHQRMAASMESRAAEIERQADRAIYSDDPDAPQALAARIAELEAERDRKKRVNAAYRKGDAAFAGALGISMERAAEMRAEIERGYSWQRKPHSLTNLSANIARLRKRLDGLRRPA